MPNMHISPERNYEVSPARRLEVADFVQQRLGLDALSVIESGHDLDNLESMEGFQARSYQLDAWAHLWDARRRGQSSRLLHMATGLGKTTVAGIDMLKYQDEYTREFPGVKPRMLYVSHKTEINEQAAESIKQMVPDLAVEMYEGRQRHLPDADLTFASFQLLHRRLDRLDPDSFEYIVWDEGHHTKADTFAQVVGHFDPHDEIAITATPNRMDGRNIRDHFGQPVYSKSLAEAMAEGWLCGVNYKVVLDQTVRQRLEQDTTIRKRSEVQKLFASVELDPSALAADIRKEVASLGLVDPKTIVFAKNIKQADELAQELGGQSYHAKIKDRRQRLADFRAGRLRTIVARDMFNEGVDIPDAELIVFARSTESEALFDQQLGRGLRRTTGKKVVHVLDYVGNVDRIAMVRELSKKVKAKARIAGAKDTTPANDVLRVHTGNDDFSFDKGVVDLLTRLRIISPQVYVEQARERMAERDEQAMSLGRFCVVEGVNQADVLRLVRKNHIIMQRMPDSGAPGFDVATQALIRELLQAKRKN